MNNNTDACYVLRSEQNVISNTATREATSQRQLDLDSSDSGDSDNGKPQVRPQILSCKSNISLLRYLARNKVAATLYTINKYAALKFVGLD